MVKIKSQSDKIENKKYRQVTVVLLVFIVLIWLVFIINFKNNSLNSFSLKSLFTGHKTHEKSNHPKVELELDPAKSKVLAKLQPDYVPSRLSRLGKEALYKATDTSETVATSDTPEEDSPWFYHSPRVGKLSPYSVVNKKRLINKEPLADFSWYESDQGDVLYYCDSPYTGWYNIDFRGWTYFKDGLIDKDSHMSPQEAGDFLAKDSLMMLVQKPVSQRKIYQKNPPQYNHQLYYKHQNYSILYRNTKTMVLSQPAGLKNTLILTSTKDYYDMPMDVVGEVKTDQGTWLHVYIGRDELGWIKKDSTLNDYVLTYYSENRLLDRIEAVLWEGIMNIDAQVGASFVNNETMSQVDANSVTFFPASTQKIYVLGEVYRQYKTGELTPDTLITLDGNQVPGAGIIQGYPNGSQFTVNELVDLVVIYSDNTAANMLIDAVGGGWVISPNVQELGLYDTALYGKYYHDAYMTTTPHDAALYFSMLYNDQINGAPYDEELIGKFTMNTHTFLRLYTPAETHAWNKSGLGETEQNDVGTFVTPYGEYSLAIFTSDPAWYNAIGDQVGELSRVVHDIFNEERALLWETVE